MNGKTPLPWEEFAASVNKFLAFREYDILRDHGKISEKMANKKASAEYEEFNKNAENYI